VSEPLGGETGDAGDVGDVLAAARELMDGPPVPLEERWVEPSPDVVEVLTAAIDPVVLAGPGLVHAGAVGGLHALAAVGNLGVVNTWGAKGVFHWQSRHHLATAGLQARDFELAGLAAADVVVAAGVHEAEAPPGWRTSVAGTVVDVSPGMLAPLAAEWRRPGRDIPFPPLRTGVGQVTQDGWTVESAPLMPSRATRHYSEVLGPDGFLAADAGLAGYWVARTYPTTALGSVVVPSIARDGLAVACAVQARLRSPERRVLAVSDGPLSDLSRAVLAYGESQGVSVPVEVWEVDGDVLTSEAHAARLGRLVADPERGEVASLATHSGQLDRMIEVAGPITAWGGLDRMA
jgi:hypothetical protein